MPQVSATNVTVKTLFAFPLTIWTTRQHQIMVAIVRLSIDLCLSQTRHHWGLLIFLSRGVANMRLSPHRLPQGRAKVTLSDINMHGHSA
jgi:hypothetical protein